MSTLNTIKDNLGARTKRMRVGRGIGSGKGKTCGRGVKGQKSRSGVAINGFEGGQMPIHRRLPKRGFNNPTRKEFETVNLADIEDLIARKKIDAKATITVDVLQQAGAVKCNKSGVKLLAKGTLSAKVTIAINAASQSAVEAIEKLGGGVTIVSDAEATSKKEIETATKADTKTAKKPSKKKAA